MIIKKGIARKLSLYFISTVLLLTLFIGVIFMILFQKHTMDVHKQELKERALNISERVSHYMDGSEVGTHGNGGMGRGAYIRFIDDIAGGDAWIVDKDMNIVTTGHRDRNDYVKENKELPKDAEIIIREVLSNNISYSDNFSSILEEKSITVGTPILNLDGDVLGAVLLHSSVLGIEQGIKSSLLILLVSLLLGMLLAIFVSTVLSVKLTKPLYRLKEIANILADGKYEVKTDIYRDDEIGELANTLDILAVKLNEASRESKKFEDLRNEFIANVSHELRTPVTVIRGYLEAINDGIIKDSNSIRNVEAQLLKETKYLERLVGDLLELSRLQNIDFSIVNEELNFIDVINDAIKTFSNIATNKNITIEKNLYSNYFGYHGDYSRLKQMLITVIDNAIKFSKSGSSIEIDFNEKGILTIKNYGEGIKNEDIPYIFEKFKKTRSEQNKEGTGLGLPIAKQIADRHNIDIEVKSEVGLETRFIFTLENK